MSTVRIIGVRVDLGAGRLAPHDFQQRHQDRAPQALEQLKQTVLSGGNIFAELMNTVRYCSLGQITGALYKVGGKYRRGM